MCPSNSTSSKLSAGQTSEMETTNFQIAKDNIALETGEKYLDLHNCYDFTGFRYSVLDREIELKWAKTQADWVPADHPKQVLLRIHEVSFLKVRARDKEIPFTEDGCLEFMGFIWNDLIEEMGSYTSSVTQEGCTHLSLGFVSGLALKISAVSAYLETN